MWIAERRFKVMPHRKPSTGWKIICWYILRASVGLMPVLSTTCMKFASQHLLYFTNFSLLNLAIPFLTFHSQCIFSEQGRGGLLFCGARCGKTLWGAAPLPADGGRRICAVPQRSAVWEGDALLCFISFCCLYLGWLSLSLWCWILAADRKGNLRARSNARSPLENFYFYFKSKAFCFIYVACIKCCLLVKSRHG